MGTQLSRSISVRRPSPSSNPPRRSMSSLGSKSRTLAANQTNADLRSYEAACRADPDLRTFDSTLQVQTSRAINSIVVGLDVRSMSLDSLNEVTECLLGMNQEVVKFILLNKTDIWKNKELSDLVDDYFENSLSTLDFCTALDACLKRAGHIESIIKVVLRKFHEEHYNVNEEGSVKNYSRTLEELRNFKTAGDPFTLEFLRIFNSVYSQQLLMLEKLQAKKLKLDKKLGKLKAWKRVSNVIFVVVFASVLICSIVAAAVSAPPVATALAAAAAVPVGSMGKWINSIWKKCGRDLRGQKDIISSMQFGNFIVIKDLENIRVLMQKFQIEIEDLLANAEFAKREDEAVVIAVEEIKSKVDGFIKTIQDLREQADKCNQDTRMARTLILRKIMNHPNQDSGMAS